jgi:CRP/FNR family transcriptional regulator, cyclic AMP receptor protein
MHFGVSLEHMHWPVFFGYLAVASSIVTCSMKTMVPLRIVSMVCNSCFIVYGAFDGVYPTLMLNSLLLPLNGVRLIQIKQMLTKVNKAEHGDGSIEWLKPLMSSRKCRRGDVLFRKGEPADALFYSVAGRFRINEIGLEIAPGEIIGELGLLAPDHRRTQTLECVEDGEVLTVTYQQVSELYYQNPKFGFYFLQLTSKRLFENVARLQDELARKNAQVAAT